jgi:hypothetical protein
VYTLKILWPSVSTVTACSRVAGVDVGETEMFEPGLAVAKLLVH